MSYDDSNIFARILRGEIPCDKVYEDEFALAFHDVNPKAPVHVLVIPKGKYKSMTEFTMEAKDEEIAGLFRALGRVLEVLKLKEKGYRMLANTGIDGGQEVPHLHLHVFGGKTLGRMISG